MAEAKDSSACEVTGCKFHFKHTTTTGKKGGEPVVHKFYVHYTTLEQLLDHAKKFTAWQVAQNFSKGVKLPESTNEFADIYANFKPAETEAVRDAAIAAMSADEKEVAARKILADYEKLTGMKLTAAKK